MWLSTILWTQMHAVLISKMLFYTNRVLINYKPKGFTQQPWALTPSSKPQHQAWDNYRSPTLKPVITSFTMVPIMNLVPINREPMSPTPSSKPQHQACDNYRSPTSKPIIASFTTTTTRDAWMNVCIITIIQQHKRCHINQITSYTTSTR